MTPTISVAPLCTYLTQPICLESYKPPDGKTVIRVEEFVRAGGGFFFWVGLHKFDLFNVVHNSINKFRGILDGIL